MISKLKNFQILTIVLMLVMVIFYTEVQAESITDHWEKLHSKMDDTLDLLAEKQTVPENSWVPFKKDKQSLDKEINALLDEAIEILNISNLSKIKQQINEHQSNISACRDRIAKLNTEKMMAPKDEAAWKIWVSDVEDYEEDIEDLEKRITENEQAIEELKSQLKEEFKKEGIEIDIEQLDTLIYSVTGDDDIEIISVFHNIKTITAKLEELTVASGENIDSAKRYYGMHALLLKILLNLQENYIDKVDGEYLPELASIEKDNQQLMGKTRSLLSTSELKHQKIYKANLEAQQLTDKTIDLYRQYLKNNKNRMSTSRKKIYKEYQAAENTYLTVSTAYTLINMMKDADNLYNSINELQVPDLLTFDNKAMKAEFKKLSIKMEK
jgi:uncharacterized coiled-coil protein SlyX